MLTLRRKAALERRLRLRLLFRVRILLTFGLIVAPFGYDYLASMANKLPSLGKIIDCF